MERGSCYCQQPGSSSLSCNAALNACCVRIVTMERRPVKTAGRSSQKEAQQGESQAGNNEQTPQRCSSGQTRPSQGMAELPAQPPRPRHLIGASMQEGAVMTPTPGQQGQATTVCACTPAHSSCVSACNSTSLSTPTHGQQRTRQSTGP